MTSNIAPDDDRRSPTRRQEDREFLQQFVEVLQESAKANRRGTLVGGVLDFGKIVAIVWGASAIVSEVKVLRRDHDVLAVKAALTEAKLNEHISDAGRVTENVDGRLSAVEGRLRIPSRPMPPMR